MPVVGNRIQADVDAVVILQVLRPRPVGDERHALAGDAFLRQQVQRVPAMRPFAGQDRQPGAIDGLENPRPKPQDDGIDLAEVVQAAEGDVALLRRRQGVDRRLALERIVAPERVRQADRLLGVAAIVGVRADRDDGSVMR